MSENTTEKLTARDVAAMIDHTALKPETTPDAIRKLCQEAKDNQFASVCVNPCYVALCKELLQGSAVKVCTVIGFPLGANTPEVKAAETRDAIERGAQEVDMVINNGARAAGDWDLVQKDIAAVVEAAAGKACVKVIIEACLLTNEEKVKACEAAKAAGADFVKTSTGFNASGATPEDVALMRKTVGADMGVKAAGGVRSFADAVNMVAAGANRLGTSGGVAIVSDPEAKIEGY